MKNKFAWLLALQLSFNISFAEIAPLDASIEKLQHDWVIANYQTSESNEKAVFKALVEQAHQVTADNPGRAEPLIWEAIVLSSYAEVKGPSGGLGLAEKARDLLLTAEKINPQALKGSIYTMLGALYYKVPSWPVGFGDRTKARKYLGMALKIDSTGIDPNYFYADFLLQAGMYAQAIEYFRKALNAPLRPGREDADNGRKQDIREGLEQAEKSLR